MRLDHDEFACNPPVITTVSAPQNGHLVDNGPPPVVDEFATAQELSRKIATSGIQNDAFLLANEDQLVANYNKWANQFPKIQPYFDVACNACPWILTSLDQLNVKFSCQSKAEINHVLRQDIDPSKIVFAGNAKFFFWQVGSHIKFANASKVPLMSFRNFGELKKFQNAEVKSDLLLALQLPTGNPETDRQWLDLLNAAKDMGLNVVGVSFLEETVPTETKVHFNKMMALTKMAFAIGQSLGHTMKVCISLITVVKFYGDA
jgi:ornithine decarboxylase